MGAVRGIAPDRGAQSTRERGPDTDAGWRGDSDILSSTVNGPSEKRHTRSVATVIEIRAVSPASFDAALTEGVKKAAETVENMKSVWRKDQEDLLKNGDISGYPVHLDVTFPLK